MSLGNKIGFILGIALFLGWQSLKDYLFRRKMRKAGWNKGAW